MDAKNCPITFWNLLTETDITKDKIVLNERNGGLTAILDKEYKADFKIIMCSTKYCRTSAKDFKVAT